jgi:hypothetical protein
MPRPDNSPSNRAKIRATEIFYMLKSNDWSEDDIYEYGLCFFKQIESLLDKEKSVNKSLQCKQ